MKMLELRFAEIHAPLFLSGEKGGMNLGTKLDPSKKSGLVLQYDREEKELHVSLGDLCAIVPATNVVSMIEKPKVVAAAAVQPKPAPQGLAIQAQVGGPQDHVHAGPGKGLTGQEPSAIPPSIAGAIAETKRGPGRPPKDK